MKFRMILKTNLRQTIKQAIWIFCIAASLAIVVNRLHPKKVHITTRRPLLKLAADTVLAQDLPDVSVRSDGAWESSTPENKTIEPLQITMPQILQLKINRQLLFLDARSEQEFLRAHIPEAENLPYKNLAAVKTKIDSLPRDKWLVCYCDGPPCDQAEQLAAELIVAGYELVAVFFDGLNGWKRAGQPVIGEETQKSVR